MEVGAGIREKYLSQATKVPVPFLYEGLEICNQADIQVRSSRNQRLTIELALVRLASLTADQKKKSVAETGTREVRDGTVSESGEAQEGTTRNAGAAPSPDEEPAPGGPVGVVKRPTISIRDQLKGSDATADQTDNGIQPDDRAVEADGSPDAGRMTAADPDRIMKAWNEYATSIKESRPRVFSTMNSNKPAISSDGSIRLLLNSEAQRENFIKNIRPELAGFICRATGIEHVEITAGVLEGPENGKKIYTEQDKLDFLAKKNPEVAQLKTRFNLDFDD
jgi:DNA polymerase-3 subunit gamma/tau